MATKPEERIDVSQYINCVDVRDDWKKQKADMLLKLQQLNKRGEVADKLLASEVSLPPERRAAQAVIQECDARRAKINAGLDRAERAIKDLQDRIDAMEPEYRRQENRIRLASALR